MSIFDPIAKSFWAGGSDTESLQEENRSLKARLAAEQLYSHPYEKITEDGTDALGSYTFVEKDYTQNPNSRVGYYRLKANVEDTANLQYFYGESYDLTELTQATRKVKMDGSYSSIGCSNGAARVIFPETMPNVINTDGSINTLSIPNFCSVPPVACYLPKHTANNASNANWITGNAASQVTEQIVVAPVGMDAPLHLHRFKLMSAATIAAILENLADVSDRADPPTLTLGAENLAKLTAEQIAVAEQKGWNLA